MNWTNKTLQGSIIFDMNVVAETQYIQLDTWNNIITEVQLLPAGSAYQATMNAGTVPVYNNPLIWEVKNPNPVCGQVLVVELPMIYGAGATLSIQVFYSTEMGGNTGVTFLDASQTEGGVWPFMFTYSQDISGRMVAPQQDTPANRITWGGCITTNRELMPYMSANTTGVYQAFYGYYKTCFYNQVPLPNYLMAAVIGDLSIGQITNFGGPASYIIAEPSVLPSAMAEFSNLQQIVNTVQNWVSTPYLFGSYRIVIMPNVYPMSGMANPMLTYTSQTTIVGDKSQEFVLVRNAAQHWTGAVVTNNNWEDQWLNEGLSTYIERMVEAQLYDQQFIVAEAFVGNSSLARQTSVIGVQNETYSTLHPVLHGQNPDYAFSQIMYEKGFQFLWWIEQSVLGYAAMNDWFIYYLTNYNLMSICAFTYRHAFSNFVESYYTDADQVNDILAMVNYEEWIYEMGPDPTGTLNFTNSATQAAVDLANAYIAANGGAVANANVYLTWPSVQQVIFHQTLLWNFNTNTAIMTAIDAALNCTGTNDPEIKERWFALGIYNDYTPTWTPAQNWVTSMGRNKYLNAIYQACAEAGVSQRTTCIGWYN